MLGVSANLYRGLSSQSIVALQEYLAAEGYFSATATGYFGPLTARAVIAMQRAAGLPATGYFGPLSRAWIAKHCGNAGASSAVTIYSITPKSGPVGTSVTLDGFGFTDDNTIHFGSGVIAHIARGSSVAIACTTDPNCRGGIHQSLTFTVPAGLDPACRQSNPPCMVASRQTTPGSYDVWVENSNGKSAAVRFTVTGASASGPSISAISPISGPVGTSVTLRGSGFRSGDIVMFDIGGIKNPTVSSDGTQLTFTIPGSIGPYCAPNMMCAMYLKQVTAGTYSVYIKDEAGGVDSNKVQFMVTR